MHVQLEDERKYSAYVRLQQSGKKYGLAAPRMVFIFIFILTNFIQNAYGSLLVPILGFFFLPTATLVYALAKPGGPGTLGWILVVTALVFDILQYTSAFGSRGFWIRTEKKAS